MKDKLPCIIRSIAVLLALTMLFSLAFACLYYFNLIQTKTFHILNWIGGVIAFGSGGILLGMYTEKKALLYAFLISILLGVFAIFIGEHTLLGMVEIFSKLAAYILMCMLFYTRKHKS